MVLVCLGGVLECFYCWGAGWSVAVGDVVMLGWTLLGCGVSVHVVVLCFDGKLCSGGGLLVHWCRRFLVFWSVGVEVLK